MATNSSEILHDFFPTIRVYKDGRVQRFKGTDVVPASVDPETGVQSKDVKISPDINVSTRLYLPKNAKAGHKLPLLVYFHGGGFVIESAFSPTYQQHLNLLTAKANIIVVSVDYRLAPEHPLPVAYEDSWLALKWVASHSKNDGDSPDEEWLKDYADFDRLYLGGDSAGGNIAHRMAMKAGLEKLGGLDVVGLFLNCPYFWGKDPIGYEAAMPAETKYRPGKLWALVYPDTTGLDDPLLNPAMDPNLSSLGYKKVLVYVAEKDVLRDRGWYYKEALGKSGWGGVAEVVEVQGQTHVFNLSSPNCENAISMLNHFAAFLNQKL